MTSFNFCYQKNKNWLEGGVLYKNIVFYKFEKNIKTFYIAIKHFEEKYDLYNLGTLKKLVRY